MARTLFYQRIEDTKQSIRCFVELPADLVSLLGEFVALDLLWIYNIHHNICGRRKNGFCPECYLVFCECEEHPEKVYNKRKNERSQWFLLNRHNHWIWISYEHDQLQLILLGCVEWSIMLHQKDDELKHKPVDHNENKYYERIDFQSYNYPLVKKKKKRRKTKGWFHRVKTQCDALEQRKPILFSILVYTVVYCVSYGVMILAKRHLR